MNNKVPYVKFISNYFIIHFNVGFKTEIKSTFFAGRAE